MSDTFFDCVELAPPDTIFGLVSEFKADSHPEKVSLVVGAYRDEEGKPYVLPVVRNVEKQIAADKTLNHEYLPIDGLKELSDAAVKLALGPDNNAITENRVAAAQSLSGTGALRICFEFIKRQLKSKTVYLPKPTWANHKKILAMSGFDDVREYAYFSPTTKGLDILGMIDSLQSAPDGSVIVLHACAQNPCGADPSKDEWKTIADVVEKKKLIVVFDMAYQGFVSGDPNIDAWAVRHFVNRGLELFLCQSFAKIFGIYNERCGNLSVVCKNSEIAMHVLSQLKAIIRPMYSNPPNHGARIVSTILNNAALNTEWREQLKCMADRITYVRKSFLEKLKAIEVPGNWSHIVNQNGLFTFTGLNAKQVAVLKEKYHIYMLPSGRVNMCAINLSNIDYIANAFKDVVLNVE